MNKKFIREAATTAWLVCLFAGLVWVIDAGMTSKLKDAYPMDAVLALR